MQRKNKVKNITLVNYSIWEEFICHPVDQTVIFLYLFSFVKTVLANLIIFSKISNKTELEGSEQLTSYFRQLIFLTK